MFPLENNIQQLMPMLFGWIMTWKGKVNRIGYNYKKLPVGLWAHG